MILPRKVTLYKICIYDISTVYSTLFIIFLCVCGASSFFLSFPLSYSFAILFLCFFYSSSFISFLLFFLSILSPHSHFVLRFHLWFIDASILQFSRCLTFALAAVFPFYFFLSLSVSRCVLSAVRRSLRYRFSHQMKAIIFGYKSRHHHPQTSFKDTLNKIPAKKPFYQRFLHYKNIK